MEARAEKRRCFPAEGVRFRHTTLSQGLLRIAAGHPSLSVLPCRKVLRQRNVQLICFGITGLEQRGGMVVALWCSCVYGKKGECQGGE